MALNLRVVPFSVPKAPNEIIDYPLEWKNVLGNLTLSAINAATAIRRSDGSDQSVTIIDTSSISGTKVILRLKAGSLLEIYDIMTRVDLNDGQRKQATFALTIEDR